MRTKEQIVDEIAAFRDVLFSSREEAIYVPIKYFCKILDLLVELSLNREIKRMDKKHIKNNDEETNLSYMGVSD